MPWYFQSIFQGEATIFLKIFVLVTNKLPHITVFNYENDKYLDSFWVFRLSKDVQKFIITKKVKPGEHQSLSFQVVLKVNKQPE